MQEPSVSLPQQPSTRVSGRAGALGILAAIVALAALWLVGREAVALVPRFTSWVQGLGIWGPVAFMGGYALAAVAFVPGSALSLAAGVIFGVGQGVIYVLVGASAGATAAFLLARHGARSWVERRFEGNVRFTAIDRAVAKEGLKIVTLLRLSPVFPFNLLNYALGLTRVRLRDYVLGCVGMVPATVLYVYSGKVLGDVAAVAGGASAGRGAGYWAVTGLGLAATVVVTTIITRTARRALAQEVQQDV